MADWKKQSRIEERDAVVVANCEQSPIFIADIVHCGAYPDSVCFHIVASVLGSNMAQIEILF
jgi:hypothetical protein